MDKIQKDLCSTVHKIVKNMRKWFMLDNMYKLNK